ncbi:helix-turn-helix domain-containing protein [Ectothiorhodospira sp. BSL-9]|uniref:helix-turn-helix domain-containing protein n=1 Tax=Ectothiorhodospira sp. BSL-9 TaxID=1442136 RepID=UPI0007B44935|nr:helix-turn-helix transcriptional regulator [Ectothiorhodospira sp. BSL-9]ANB02141.1 XRE family transcriptional regulator [Ectothiorhodospira sp. BSL-9]
MSFQAQIIERDGKPEYAVVPIDQYRRLLALAEGMEDVRAADEAMRELEEGRDELVPAEIVSRLVNGDVHPLRVWREHRGLSQAALAEQAGIGKSYLSQIEAGKRIGSAKVLRALARALVVDVEDLLPSATSGEGEM